MKQFNDLTAAEQERLALIAEEAGEVVQAVGKILRHGYESTHPNSNKTNRESLERELGDLKCAMNIACRAKDIDYQEIQFHSGQKEVTVGKYLHHQRA